MNNTIGIVLKLSLAGLCVSAFPQDTSKTIDGRGRSGLQLEVEFMNARTDILVAENASKDPIDPRIDLETFQIMQNALKTNEIMLLEANIRIAQANLFKSGKLMTPELAKDKAHLEILLLNLVTKESIEKEERYKAAYDLALTEEVQRARDKLTIL